MLRKCSALLLALTLLLSLGTCALAEWAAPPADHIRITEIRATVDLSDMSYESGPIYAITDEGEEIVLEGDVSKWFDGYEYYGTAEYGSVEMRMGSPGELYFALADDSLSLMIYTKDGTNHGMCFVPGATFRYAYKNGVLKLDQPDDQDDVVDVAVDKYLYSSPR